MNSVILNGIRHLMRSSKKIHMLLYLIVFQLGLSKELASAKSSNQKTISNSTSGEKVIEHGAYFIHLEDQLEDLLVDMMKKSKLKISNRNIMMNEKSEFLGVTCHSIRGFFKHEGIRVGKITEETIDSLVSILKKNFSEELIIILKDDFIKQRQIYFTKKDKSNKSFETSTKTTKKIPAYCMAEFKEPSDIRYTVYVSPLSLESSDQELGVQDVNHAQVKKEIEEEIKKEKPNKE